MNIHGTDAYDADTENDFPKWRRVDGDRSMTKNRSQKASRVPSDRIGRNIRIEIDIQMGDVAFLIDTTCPGGTRMQWHPSSLQS